MGDYIDIASFQGTAYPIWTDNRNASDTIDPVYGCVDQDIYTVPERVPIQVSFVSTLDSSTVTINGSLTVDRLLLKSGANLTVRAVATASGATTFTKTYSVSNLTMRSVPASGFQTRFLLNVPVLPYALSWDLAPNLQTIAASVNIVLTRELDIDGNGVVDIVDFSIVAFDYGSSTGSS